MKKWRKSRLIALLLALVLTVSFMPQIGARAADNFETDTALINDPDEEDLDDDGEEDPDDPDDPDDPEDPDDPDDPDDPEDPEDPEEPTPTDGDMITVMLEGVYDENPRVGNTVYLPTDEYGMVEITFEGGSYINWDEDDPGVFTFPRAHASDVIIRAGSGFDPEVMQLQLLTDGGYEKLVSLYGSVSFAAFESGEDSTPLPDSFYLGISEDGGEDPYEDAYYMVQFDKTSWKIGGKTVTLEGYGIVDDPEPVDLEDYNEFEAHEQLFLSNFDKNTMSVMYTRDTDNKEIICNDFYDDSEYGYTIVDIFDGLGSYDWQDSIYTFSVVAKQIPVEDTVRKATITMSATGKWIGTTPITSAGYPAYGEGKVSVDYAGFYGMLAVSIEDSAPTSVIESYNDDYTNKQVITYEREAETKNVTFKFRHKDWGVCVDRLKINGKDYTSNLTFYKNRADWFSHFDKNGVTFEIKNVPVQTATSNVNKENYNIEVEMRPVTRDECYLSRFTWADDEHAEEVLVSAAYKDDKNVSRTISHNELVAAGSAYPYLHYDEEVSELLIPAGAEVTMYLRPDYGYQIKKLTPSGTGTVSPIAAMSGYTVTTDCGDYELGIQTAAVKTDTTAAKKITGAEVTFREKAVSEGTVRLVAEDATPSDATMFDSALAQVNALDEQADFEIVATICLTLSQIVKKGGLEADAWESVLAQTPGDKLTDPATLSLTLSDDIDANDIAILHDNIYIRRFDTKDNTVTFDADSFGYFAIATRKVEKPLVQTDIEDVEITLSKTEAVYNGTDQMPTVEKVSFDETELVPNTDYTVKSVECVNAGTYTIELEGIGNWKGTAKKEFKINSAPVTVKPGTLALKTRTYDATELMELKGAIEVEGILEKDADKVHADPAFTSVYVEDKNVGEKKFSVPISLTQDGENYQLMTPTVEATGKIGKKEIAVSGLKLIDKEFDGNRYMILESTKPTVTGVIAGDEVFVETKSDRYLITGNASAGDKRRKLTKGIFAVTGADAKNYNLKVGMEVTGTIKRAEIGKVTLKKTSVKASKKAQKPVVTEVLTTGGRKVLTKNYKITYFRGKKATTDFTSKGTITVKVSGIGKNFTGTVAVKYTIK